MKFRRIAVLAVVSHLMTPVVVAAETIADALVSAYEHSGLITQNRALLRAADEDVAQAVSQLRPIIDWTAKASQEYGKVRTPLGKSDLTGTGANLSLTASLLISDFGKTRSQIEAAKENVLATRQNLLSVEQQVLQRAVNAYMNVIRTRRVVDVRRNNVGVIREELRATQDRFDVGEVTRTDIAQSEARLAEAKSNLAVAEGELEAAVAEYRSAIGRKPGKLRFPKERPRVKGGEPTAMQVAMLKHPDLKSAQHSVASAELNIRVAEALVRPTVSLFGTANIDESLDNDSYIHGGTVGVQAGGPIYQGGRLNSLRRQAIDLRDAQIGRMHFVRHNVREGVSDAFARLDASIATEKANKERVRAQRVAFDGVREEARLGVRTTLDVLNSEQELLDARVALISAEVSVYEAAYAVISAMGELTVRDLRLKTPTYDPSVYYNMAKDAPATVSRQGKQLDRILKELGKQ